MKSPALRGLYCITDPVLAKQFDRPLVNMVEQAILGGAKIIQYRDKTASLTESLKTASSLARLCREHNVLLLINDDPQLALESGADGVHIGQDDAALPAARKILGPDKIIGVTCHNQPALAKQAEAASADYVAFGRFFPSQTKPDAAPASLDILTQLDQLSIPVVAIGGIQAANATPLLQAGVQMLAVIHAVFAQPDITAAAKEFSALFAHSNKEA